VLMQGCSSVSLVILNKYLATYFEFPIMTLMMQNGIATILSILAWAGGVGPTMNPWKKEHFVKVVPAAALFTVLIWTSFLAMGRISIATIVIARNATPLCTALAERFVRNEQFSQRAMTALSMMVVGGFIYALGDLEFDPVGYGFAALNLGIGVMAGLYGKQLSMDLKKDQTGLGVACYQNIISIPMFIVVGMLTGEAGRWQYLGGSSGKGDLPTMVLICGLISCVACVTMGIATFELQRLVPQATVAVANVSYKLISLILGAMIYGNNVGFVGLVGLVVAQVSAMLYVYEKQIAGKKEEPPPTPAAELKDLESPPIGEAERDKLLAGGPN